MIKTQYIHTRQSIIKEMQEAGIHSMIGEFQWIYENKKGSISLITLPNYLHGDVTLWEIYSMKGNLFDDIDRFESQLEAEVRIKEILGEDIPTEVIKNEMFRNSKESDE